MADHINLEEMIAKAEELGKQREEMEKENKRRVRKGLPALPDPQDAKDMAEISRPARQGARTISAAEALKMIEMGPSEESEEEVIPVQKEPPPKAAKKTKGKKRQEEPSDIGVDESSNAVKQAEAARRVEDMKNGRINHTNNWKMFGVDMALEGGAETVIADHEKIKMMVSAQDEAAPLADENQSSPDPNSSITELFKDLYNKLGVSFDALETTLSDLQGRVAEIVTASVGKVQDVEEEGDDEYRRFKETMSGSTPVTYDIGGTRITFNAVCVYKEPPCITIVTRSDAANVKPKPGSKLRLTYDYNGTHYENDTVTFLGTRFTIPELGVSFSGFVRDSESELLDIDANS